jgi:hypothetical protein
VLEGCGGEELRDEDAVVNKGGTAGLSRYTIGWEGERWAGGGLAGEGSGGSGRLGSCFEEEVGVKLSPMILRAGMLVEGGSARIQLV